MNPHQGQRWSINVRFTLLILLATMFFFITAYLATFNRMQDFSLEQSEMVGHLILESTDTRLKSLFQNFESLTTALALTPVVFRSDKAGMRDLFISMVLGWKRYIRSIYLGTADGAMYEWGYGREFVNFLPPLPKDYDARERPWYRLALESDGFAVTRPYRFASIDAPGITCVQKVYTPDGTFVGVLGIDILLEHLQNIVSDVNIPNQGWAFILSADGSLVVGQVPEAFALIKDSQLESLKRKGEGSFSAVTSSGELNFYYRKSQALDWFLIAAIPTASIMAPVTDMLSVISLIELVIMVIQLFALNIISNRLVSAPLRQMVSIINRIEGGETSLRLPVYREDEFGLLAGELNSLFNTVQDYSRSLETKVKERTDRLRKLRKENMQLKIAEERRRIYHDLHDSIGARLTNIFFSVNVARKALERDPGKLGELFESIEQNSLAAVQNLKTIVSGDIKASSFSAGFISTLKGDLEQRLGAINCILRFTCRSPKKIDALPLGIQQELVKLFEELVSNVLKHSEATLVRVSFSVSSPFLVISFRDNGKGFAVQDSLSGIGLSSIARRVRILGGTYTLDSGPGQGTAYTFRFPFFSVDLQRNNGESSL